MGYGNLSNHKRAKMYKEKSRLIGRDILEIELLDGDRVKLLHVLDKDDTGGIEIPSFITDFRVNEFKLAGCDGDVMGVSCFSRCKYSSVHIDNSNNIKLDASNLFAQMDSVDLRVTFSNPQNIVNMRNMFNGCIHLINLDIGSIDTSNVEDMSGLFYNCSSIRSIDISRLDTSNVKDMSKMFAYCKELRGIDLSNLDTSKVEDMRCMFGFCSSIRSIDISMLNTSSVRDMGKMFINCRLLDNLKVLGIDISNVINMDKMYDMCKSLKELR